MSYFEEKFRGKRESLLVGSHFLSRGFNHEVATTSTPGLAVLEGEKWIIKAGSIYPSNDENAIGIVDNDYDVTRSAQNIAVIVHGLVKLSGLPQPPTSDAITAMKLINFVEPT